MEKRCLIFIFLVALLLAASTSYADYGLYYQDGVDASEGFSAVAQSADEQDAIKEAASDSLVYFRTYESNPTSLSDFTIWVAPIPNDSYIAQNADYVEKNESHSSGEFTLYDVYDDQDELIGRIEVEEEEDGTVFVTYFDSNWQSIGETQRVSVYTLEEFLAAYGFGAVKEEAQASAVIETARIASQQTTQMVSTRILSLFSPRPSMKKVAAASSNPFQAGYSEAPLGMASGDGAPMFGAWGMGSYSIYENDKAGYRTDGNVGVLLAGLDRLFLEDRLAVGVAAGYENNYYKLKDYDEKYRGTGYAITPYAAYRVTDQFLLKALTGVTFLDYDVSGNSDYSATRTMTDLSAEYSWYIDAWQLTAEGGWMYINEGANHDYKDVYLAEGRLAAKVGYEVAPNMLPYAKLTYHNDLAANKASELDDDDLQGALGINVFHDAWIFSIEGIYTFEREDEELYGGSVLVRYEF